MCVYQWLKNVPLDKMQLVDNKNFRIYSGKSFRQSLKISLKYFHCFKNHSFAIL